LPPAPKLLTFDIFGTVLDWRRGLREAVAAEGLVLDDRAFERVIDRQAAKEAGPYRTYAAIVEASLVATLRMKRAAARAIAAAAGGWPLFPDSADALRALMRIAPCVATTNSDTAHGKQVQDQLGYRMSGWICAEEVRCYKPAPEFWRAVAARRGVSFGPEWWHVSAYADYDLEPAARLGLTCVFVERPHARWGPAALRVADLRALATAATRAASAASSGP
jgi:2-haloalkanoic acid dehalogenase type II